MYKVKTTQMLQIRGIKRLISKNNKSLEVTSFAFKPTSCFTALDQSLTRKSLFTYTKSQLGLAVQKQC